MSQVPEFLRSNVTDVSKHFRALNAKLAVDQLSFDYDCSQGQVRALSTDLVNMKKKQFDLNHVHL